MIKLLAIDLDGTLLNSDKRISEVNLNSVRNAVDRGVKVVVCSGRVFKGARAYARQIGLKGPLISSNGAVIKEIDTEEVIYQNLLNLEDALKVIEICHQERVYFHSYIGDVMYTENRECPSKSYWKGNDELPEEDRVEIRVVEDFGRVVRESGTTPAKFVIISKEPEKLAKTREYIKEISGVDVMSSHYDNFEIVNRGVNKGNALKILSQRYQVTAQELMAIGDNENDFAMLKFAGIKIAMGNADEKIKEISDYVTLTNDQNGVSKAIEKFILKM
ncbi:MAG: Cof-type HAD-IIB family hydrolase [Clostridia bacterium]|nr:Cof-type HAD-IIB family hydrolase [Clostridia bacterium]